MKLLDNPFMGIARNDHQSRVRGMGDETLS